MQASVTGGHASMGAVCGKANAGAANAAWGKHPAVTPHARVWHAMVGHARAEGQLMAVWHSATVGWQSAGCVGQLARVG